VLVHLIHIQTTKLMAVS